MIYEVKNSFSKSKFSLKKINGKIYVKKTPLKFNKENFNQLKNRITLNLTLFMGIK